MIKVFDDETNAELGTITEEQLQFLMDHLEEEGRHDQDYYINQATLEEFKNAGADSQLLELLKSALGSRESMDIRWEEA